MRWVSERHESNISANEIISFGRRPEVEISPTLDELCLFLGIEDVIIVIHDGSWTGIQQPFFTWFERVSFDSRFESHISFVLREGLHLLQRSGLSCRCRLDALILFPSLAIEDVSEVVFHLLFDRA